MDGCQTDVRIEVVESPDLRFKRKRLPPSPALRSLQQIPSPVLPQPKQVYVSPASTVSSASTIPVEDVAMPKPAPAISINTNNYEKPVKESRLKWIRRELPNQMSKHAFCLLPFGTIFIVFLVLVVYLAMS